MDKFLALPLPQRLLVVGVILAVVGGASYYFLVSPLTDDIATQAKKYKGLMGDYAKLKEYDSDQFRNQMVRERAEADKRAAAYARMLPREEEIPNLITSIKADADSAGLVLSRFDPVKKREEGQGYRALMINLDVAGTYSQFLTFLQTLAAPTKRLINVKNLSLEITPAGPLMGSAGDVGLLRLLNEREHARGLNSNERYYKQVLMYDESAKNVLLHATFVAIAYVYTGGGVPPAPAAAAGGPGAPGGPGGAR